MKTTIGIQRLKFYLWVGLAWTFLWLFTYLVTNPETFFLRVVNEIWRNAYLIAVNFIFFEYTWPFIKKKRKYIFFNIVIGLLLFWVLMMMLSYGLYGWRQLGIQLHIYTPFRKDDTLDHAIEYQTQGGVMSLFFFGIIKHINDYRNLKLATQQLRIEKKVAELNYLKSQTNPHFLFNTLNNIYSLSRDKSDLAPESILRLSKILRFMLYETGGEYIAIEQELKIISDYIALEKLRYDDTLRINFNHDIEDMRQALPPLLLIPLVENAFKHGVSETRNQPFIDIHLSTSRRQLSFIVKNSTEKFPEEKGVKENIGLSNLRRQLELLYKDFNLTVQQGESVFTATLKLIWQAMSKIRCIIIEDEPLAAKVLSDYIMQVPFLELQGTFKDAILATDYLRDNTIDLMFLDIHLPKLKGMAFLKTLTHPPAVIITTAYHQYAVEGFDLNVTDYLLKPVEFERFLIAVTKVKSPAKEKQEESQEIKDFIFLNVQKKKVKILFSEIVYIESQREYIKIVTTKNEFFSKMSTHEIEALLPGNLFKRIHRSYIVSVGKIESYTAEMVEVNGVSIPIGRGYRDVIENL